MSKRWHWHVVWLGVFAPLQTGAAVTQDSLALAEQWQDGGAPVTQGEDGKVVFLYGAAQPVVVCSPLQVCDIQLQEGELVQDVLVGDAVRWKVEAATSGVGTGQSVHLVVKPAEAGLITSMVITTSARTYHLELRSDAHRYMARVGFDYPDEIALNLAAINERLAASTVPGAGVPAERLDFNYRIEGEARWKPVRVYTDGIKTFIQFPAALSGSDAPVLFVISGGQNRIVNYRLSEGMMVVDYLVDNGVLLAGVGRDQQRITLRRVR